MSAVGPTRVVVWTNLQMADMVNNSRSLSATQVPNENYAREIMQLFSIGLWKLNPDGTQDFNAEKKAECQ